MISTIATHHRDVTITKSGHTRNEGYFVAETSGPGTSGIPLVPYLKKLLDRGIPK